jgi:tRNA-specific 2-thiouridylase
MPSLSRVLSRSRRWKCHSRGTRLFTAAAKKRVCVGISGGVDSSVAALLLKRQGYEVVGVHMTNWDSAEEAEYNNTGSQRSGTCTQTEDLRMAERVCVQLGIPLKRVNFVPEYWNGVFEPLLTGYRKGLTPNPDVWCNREVKFKPFLDHCTRRLGADYIATGHYARLRRVGAENVDDALKQTELLSGVDPVKDQSYFLCAVPEAALARTLFPLGGMLKSEVRAIAAEAGLASAKKKDSYGLCFVGKRKFGDFLGQYVEPRPGPLVSIIDGAVLGNHSGLERATIGQGARIGGAKEKWVVAGKREKDNAVLCAPGLKHPAVYTREVLVRKDDFCWVEPDGGARGDALRLGGSIEARYRVRHGQALGRCRVSHVDGEEGAGGVLRLSLEHPQRAVSPGQIAALYSADDDVCFGGGPILRAGPSLHDTGESVPENAFATD